MAFTVYAIHGPDAAKFASVKDEMLTLGAPTIKVVDCGDHYMALEGSHRLAAAHALGIVPNLDIIDQDAEIEISSFDWFDEANWGGTTYLAGEVASELFSPAQAVDYRFGA